MASRAAFIKGLIFEFTENITCSNLLIQNLWKNLWQSPKINLNIYEVHENACRNYRFTFLQSQFLPEDHSCYTRFMCSNLILYNDLVLSRALYL